jgi:dimethylargininase
MPQTLRVFDFNSALVRQPGKSVVDGLTSTPGTKPTFEAICSEHESYIEALEALKLDVISLPPLEKFPDSIFVEDPALVFSQAAILLRPGAPTRLAEVEQLAPALRSRFQNVLQLTDGFADGGDILVTPDGVFIGLSARTDAAGAENLKRLLESIGLKAKAVNVPAGTLHLKTACSLVDEDTALVTEAMEKSGVLKGFRLLVVPPEEHHATNAIRVNDVVFVRAGCPRTQELLEKHGLRVIALPASEIAKLDAGLSCMSLRWFDPDARS